MGKGKSKSVPTEKKELAKLCLAQGKTLAETSQTTGIPISTIATWKTGWKDDPAFLELKQEEERELIRKLKSIRDKSLLLLSKKVDIALSNPEKTRETLRDVSSVFESMSKQLDLKQGNPTEIVQADTNVKFKSFEEFT